MHYEQLKNELIEKLVIPTVYFRQNFFREIELIRMLNLNPSPASLHSAFSPKGRGKTRRTARQGEGLRFEFYILKNVGPLFFNSIQCLIKNVGKHHVVPHSYKVS